MRLHRPGVFPGFEPSGRHIMRGILLWAIGIPIPVIILIYLLF
jgi:hypothetical protein